MLSRLFMFAALAATPAIALADDPRASGQKGYAIGCSAAAALGIRACGEMPSGRQFLPSPSPSPSPIASPSPSPSPRPNRGSVGAVN